MAGASVIAYIIFTFQYVSINTWLSTCLILPIWSFTFQYVSINTWPGANQSAVEGNLHSNMFLLIRFPELFQLHRKLIFTFQYVSINTHGVGLIRSSFRDLHSNMFLLIRFMIPLALMVMNLIYIPICFY